MPPRLRFSSSYIRQPVRRQRALTGQQNEVIRGRRHVSMAPAAVASAVVVPPPSLEQINKSPSRIARTPSVQPPSHRRPEERRSQLLRQYTALIRTAPLMVFFQHNNLQSIEWTAIRRELVQALRKVDEQQASEGRSTTQLAPHVKLQIIQTSIFEVALRIVDHFRPEKVVKGQSAAAEEDVLMHDLSRTVHGAVRHLKGKHELSSVLSGPLAVLSFPNVSPEHLKAALSILAPKASGFSAPTRKANPGYHELTVQGGLQKLMLVAVRVDGQVFDLEGTKWVGSIESGLDGLRAQLVHALQAIGAGVTSTLEGAGKSLYLTMESRRSVLEEEQKGEGDKEQS